MNGQNYLPSPPCAEKKPESKPIPNLGIGLGLRIPHYDDIFKLNPDVDWFEIISENFMVDGGLPIEHLERILERYPVVQHGVTLSIGGPHPLDFDYLRRLKNLTRKTKTPWVSDHLCWGQVPGAHFHDLLPIPHTKAMVEYVAERAHIVQDFLELPFALENLSSYVGFVEDEMSEWEFYSAVVEAGNISMMLDVNNVYVSSRNHSFNPIDYLDSIPLERVIQMHIAGHSDFGDYVLDTHDHPVRDEVWNLYEYVYARTGGVSTLLEWDDNIPTFEETWAEAKKAKKFQNHLNNKYAGSLR